MEHYSILLPNSRTKTYRYFSLFILLMNALLFGIIRLYSFGAWAVGLNTAGFVMSALFFGILLYKVTKKPSLPFHSIYAFVLISVAWLLQWYFIPAIAMLLLASISFVNEREHRILFTEETIIYPSFPKQILSWSDLNNVILKDRVLTLDFKNNKIVQEVIVAETDNILNEAVFNAFCRKFLQAAV